MANFSSTLLKKKNSRLGNTSFLTAHVFSDGLRQAIDQIRIIINSPLYAVGIQSNENQYIIL